MLNPLYAAFLLTVEAQKVIELRLVRIAWGGAEGRLRWSRWSARRWSPRWRPPTP